MVGCPWLAVRGLYLWPSKTALSMNLFHSATQTPKCKSVSERPLLLTHPSFPICIGIQICSSFPSIPVYSILWKRKFNRFCKLATENICLSQQEIYFDFAYNRTWTWSKDDTWVINEKEEGKRNMQEMNGSINCHIFESLISRRVLIVKNRNNTPESTLSHMVG